MINISCILECDGAPSWLFNVSLLHRDLNPNVCLLLFCGQVRVACGWGIWTLPHKASIRAAPDVVRECHRKASFFSWCLLSQQIFSWTWMSLERGGAGERWDSRGLPFLSLSLSDGPGECCSRLPWSLPFLHRPQWHASTVDLGIIWNQVCLCSNSTGTTPALSSELVFIFPHASLPFIVDSQGNYVYCVIWKYTSGHSLVRIINRHACAFSLFLVSSWGVLLLSMAKVIVEKWDLHQSTDTHKEASYSWKHSTWWYSFY